MIDQKTLDDLKKIVILTGQLSEVHTNTLKMAPFVFFDGLEKVEVTHNIVTDSGAGIPGFGSRIGFVLFFEDGHEHDLLDKRVLALKNTVKTLLWPDIAVAIVDQTGKELK